MTVPRPNRTSSRDRWSLFAGAVVTVCLGVALVQSSLLLLLSIATRPEPPGLSPVAAMGFAATRRDGVALMGVTLGFSAFLAVFVIGSTFAFTVAQRRRDLALLRLLGGVRRQVRRVLLGEAVVLGAVGAVAGVLVGPAVAAVQSGLLAALGFVPAGFEVEWRWWVLAVSLGSGVGLAVAGVLVAARRAASISPLEALRGTGEAAAVMTRGRWWLGAVFATAAVLLAALAPLGGAAGGQAMAVTVSVCASVALAALGPVAVPAAARLVPFRGVVGRLATANLRDGVRRSASVAAPLVVLTGLVLGQATALASFAAAGRLQERQGTAADFVVESPGTPGTSVSAVPGVVSASTETEVPVALTTGSGDLAYTETRGALVVDPAAYERAHPGSGSLAELRGADPRGAAVAAGPGGDGVSAGDSVGVGFGGTDLGRLPVVAEVPPGVAGGPALLLPRGLIPEGELTDAPSRTFVTLAPDADRTAVAAALTALGSVSTLDEWLAGDARARTGAADGVLVVVLGLGGLYALIGLVNSVVIATAERRREFATARATGLTRSQVVRSALVESTAVTAIGLVLGFLAAAGTLAAALTTTASVTGTATAAVPWGLVLALGVGAFPVVGATSLLASWSATRPSPVSLLRAAG